MSNRMQYQLALKITLFQTLDAGYPRKPEKVRNAKRPYRRSSSTLLVCVLPHRNSPATIWHSLQYGCEQSEKWSDKSMIEIRHDKKSKACPFTKSEGTHYMLVASSSFMAKPAKWTKASGVYWQAPFFKLNWAALQMWWIDMCVDVQRCPAMTHAL